MVHQKLLIWLIHRSFSLVFEGQFTWPWRHQWNEGSIYLSVSGKSPNTTPPHPENCPLWNSAQDNYLLDICAPDNYPWKVPPGHLPHGQLLPVKFSPGQVPLGLLHTRHFPKIIPLPPWTTTPEQFSPLKFLLGQVSLDFCPWQ